MLLLSKTADLKKLIFTVLIKKLNAVIKKGRYNNKKRLLKKKLNETKVKIKTLNINIANFNFFSLINIIIKKAIKKLNLFFLFKK